MQTRVLRVRRKSATPQLPASKGKAKGAGKPTKRKLKPTELTQGREEGSERRKKRKKNAPEKSKEQRRNSKKPPKPKKTGRVSDPNFEEFARIKEIEVETSIKQIISLQKLQAEGANREQISFIGSEIAYHRKKSMNFETVDDYRQAIAPFLVQFQNGRSSNECKAAFQRKYQIHDVTMKERKEIEALVRANETTCAFCGGKIKVEVLQSTTCTNCFNQTPSNIMNQQRTKGIVPSRNSKYTRAHHFRALYQRLTSHAGLEKVPEQQMIAVAKRLFGKNICRAEDITIQSLQEVISDMEWKNDDASRRLLKANIWKIYYCLTGKRLENPHKLYNVLEEMFLLLQEPFYRLGNRNNFFSYPFVLRSLLETLELYDLAALVPSLKMPKNRMKQQRLFARIAEDLGWNYKPLEEA